MSDAKPEATEAEAKPASGGGGGKIYSIVVLLNTLAVLGTAGVVVYTKLLFKRPPITESQERVRLKKLKDKTALDTRKLTPGMVTFESITVNIRSSPGQLHTTESGNIEGKLHYASLAFALELKDASKIPLVEELKPMFMDKLMSMLGRKSYGELTTVQGRFMLRTQMMDAVNDLILQDQAERTARRAARKRKEAADRGEKETEKETKGPEDDEGDRTAEARDVLVTNVFFSQFMVQ